MDSTISIITVCYNSEVSILDCVNSVGQQDFKHLEHIIIDGKSSDKTIPLLEAHSRKQNVNLISEPDKGIYDAFNKGLALATGDIIAFLNSDDVFESKSTVSQVMRIFQANKDIQGVYGDVVFIDRRNKIVRRWKSSSFRAWKLKFGWVPPHPTLFIKREWYRKTGVFDSKLNISGDYKKMLELFLSKEFKTFYFPETLVVMRAGGASNGSIRALVISSLEDWVVLRTLGFSIVMSGIALFFKKFFKMKQLISARCFLWNFK